jgi:hypothetical protein
MKQVIPEKVQRCFFEVKESDTGAGYYWEGWCESDKDGERMNDNECLTLRPEHFIGSQIVEVVPTCPDCGQCVEFNSDDGEWYCGECSK